MKYILYANTLKVLHDTSENGYMQQVLLCNFY